MKLTKSFEENVHGYSPKITFNDIDWYENAENGKDKPKSVQIFYSLSEVWKWTESSTCNYSTRMRWIIWKEWNEIVAKNHLKWWLLMGSSVCIFNQWQTDESSMLFLISNWE